MCTSHVAQNLEKTAAHRSSHGAAKSAKSPFSRLRAAGRGQASKKKCKSAKKYLLLSTIIDKLSIFVKYYIKKLFLDIYIIINV